MSEPFIAEVRIFASNFAPRGWAFCNGQLLAIAQNTALFSLLGTTYGGDGRTTFALPDLQGRTPVHPRQGPGLTPRALGEQGGSANTTLTEGQVPQHSHAMQAVGALANTDVPTGTTSLAATPGRARRGVSLYGAPNNLTAMNAAALADTGGSQPHNNMQPYLVLNFIIALVGIYPSRS